MNTKSVLGAALAVVAFSVLLVCVPVAAGDTGDTLSLVPNTAVLLAKVASGTSGNGGNTSSTSNATNIFAPASYVDYHQIGGEPTTVVDRYPFSSSFQCAAFVGGGGSLAPTPAPTACQSEAACPAGSVSCFHDL